MRKVALLDSGYIFALLNDDDNYHLEAVEWSNHFSEFTLVLPWPILYETLNTKMMKAFDQDKSLLRTFSDIIELPNVELLSDGEYRRLALEDIRRHERSYEYISLVDRILMGIIEDIEVGVRHLFTFDRRDFSEVCARNSVTIGLLDDVE